jgi:hypothetical protein
VKKLIVFDLDGTLGESKSSVDSEMSELLHDLLAIVKVAVISGGDWPQFEKQLLSNLRRNRWLRQSSLVWIRASSHGHNRQHPFGPGHPSAPKIDPTPAVSAMASAPQNVTRIAPNITAAPPTRAASPPRRARNTSEVPETRGIKPPAGAIAVTKRGMAAPAAKHPADASAA